MMANDCINNPAPATWMFNPTTMFWFNRACFNTILTDCLVKELRLQVPGFYQYLIPITFSVDINVFFLSTIPNPLTYTCANIDPIYWYRTGTAGMNT